MVQNHIQAATYTFLTEQKLATLVTIGENNIPETAVVFFFVDTNFTCYFVTKIGTRKYKNLAERHLGTLFVYNEEKLISVEMKGKLSITTDIHEILQTITKFQELVVHAHASYWIPPIAQIEAGDYVVCKLTPESVSYNNYAQELQTKTTAQQVTFKP